MKKSKTNNVALIYFSFSWFIGIIAGIFSFLGVYDEIVLVFLFLSFINFIINFLVILVLITWFYIFLENRIEFRNSIILLLFNFPFLMVLYFIISII